MDAQHGAAWAVRQPSTAASESGGTDVSAFRYQPLVVVVVAVAAGIVLDRYGNAALALKA